MESKFIVKFLPSNLYSARRVIAIAVSHVGRTNETRTLSAQSRCHRATASPSWRG